MPCSPSRGSNHPSVDLNKYEFQSSDIEAGDLKTFERSSFSGEVDRTSSRATSTLSNGDAFVDGSSPVASEFFFVLLLQICRNKHLVRMSAFLDFGRLLL